MEKTYIKKCNILIIVSKYLFAIIMLLSGISKLFYINGFSIEVSQYLELYISSIYVPWSYHISVFVCCIEIMLGIMLLIPKWSLISLLSLFILMSFFLYLTGINYLKPTVLGSIESCGCFGELIHFSAKGSFIKTVLLWTIIAIIIIYVLFLNKIKGEYSEKRSE